MNKVILKSEMLAESKLEFKINCEIIKKCVEKESYIVDLGTSSRKAYIRDCRFAYYKICKELSTDYFSLQIVADVVNRICHSTVINGLKEFDYQYGKELFFANEIYKESLLRAIKGIQIDNKKLLIKIKRIQRNEDFLISQIKVDYELISA